MNICLKIILVLMGISLAGGLISCLIRNTIGDQNGMIVAAGFVGVGFIIMIASGLAGIE